MSHFARVIDGIVTNVSDAVATTGSPTYNNSGGFKVYTFTSSGSINF